jgi:peptidoglycan/LPS O-acetylase OafA/YrhL
VELLDTSDTRSAPAESAVRQSSEREEIRPLTGIRGLASLMVGLFHFHASWMLLLPLLKFCEPLALRGHLGVDLFFILSGFILSYVHYSGTSRFGLPEYRKFLWLRIARMFPNHVATIVCVAVLVLAAKLRHLNFTGDYPLSGLPFQLTMTHAWPYAQGGAWNYPSWSISAEWFAYIAAFPLVWHLLKRAPGAVTSVIIGFALLAVRWVTVDIPALKEWGRIILVSSEFIAGGLFFNAYLHSRKFTSTCQQWASLVALVILGALFLPPNFAFAPAIVIALFPPLLVGLTAETSRFSKLLSLAPALWLGRISYALYMTHGISQKVIKVILPSEHYTHASLPVRLSLLAVNAVLILAPAAALYYFVEVPSRNFLRRLAAWWSARRTTANQDIQVGSISEDKVFD